MRHQRVDVDGVTGPQALMLRQEGDPRGRCCLYLFKACSFSVASEAGVARLMIPAGGGQAPARIICNDECLWLEPLQTMRLRNERSGEILTQFLSDAVPSGCEIQLVHWQSPSVGTRIADWVMPRVVAKGVYGRAAAHRARWLRRGAWMSISRDAPFFVRSTRLRTASPTLSAGSSIPR